MPDEQGYFIIIPARVRLDNRLSLLEKMLYGEVLALSQRDGRCWASNQHFADIYQRTPEVISRSIKTLCKVNYLTSEIRKEEGNRRYLKTIDENINSLLTKTSRPIDENVKSYCQKHQDPIDENIKYNKQDNIINKNTCSNESLFDLFWNAYPRHVSKSNARKAFAKLNPDSGPMETILRAIEQQKQSPDWQRDDGQYIPYPASWLNGRRWEDELSSNFEDDEAKEPISKWVEPTPEMDEPMRNHITEATTIDEIF